MTFEEIEYQPGPVARITLNRPEFRNAQSRVLLEELDVAFREAQADESIRVVVLDGRGASFSAGHDLGSPPELADREAHGFPNDRLGRYVRQRELFFDNTLRWRDFPKPTIAMVHGYCIFGGWMIASAMDLVFASSDAQFLPSHGQYFSLPGDVMGRKAKEILYDGALLTAVQAQEVGLVNRVFPSESLEQETLAFAEKVAARDPLTLRTIKFSVNQAQDAAGYTTSLRAAFHAQMMSAGLEDLRGRRPAGGPRRLEAVDQALRERAVSEHADD